MIKALGYKSYKQPIKFIGNSIVIKLENHTYELKAVIITDLSAASIVATALKYKRKNYPKKGLKPKHFIED